MRLIHYLLLTLLATTAAADDFHFYPGRAEPQGGAEIEILVEDSGAGISVSDVGRALEPFFTTKAREGGTGLGLAIAREIVANHRGRLVFTRGEPRGTRAAIRLPPVEAAANV